MLVQAERPGRLDLQGAEQMLGTDCYMPRWWCSSIHFRQELGQTGPEKHTAQHTGHFAVSRGQGAACPPRQTAAARQTCRALKVGQADGPLTRIWSCCSCALFLADLSERLAWQAKLAELTPVLLLVYTWDQLITPC